MAENKKSFLLYCDLIHTVEKMPIEKAGELFMHILKYVNDTNPITNDLIIQLTFEPIKQALKRDLDKWETQLNQRKQAGKRSAEIRKQNSTSVNERSISSTVSVNVNDTVIVKDNIEIRKSRFASTLQPFLLMYGKDMLNDFYSYWTEHGEHDKKFRSEKEKSFSIERRLETWKRNEKTFNKQPLKAERL